MRIKKEIRDKIISDNMFSLEVALAMNKTQASVVLRAKRNSEALTNEKAVEVYRKYGFENIYEDEY